MSVLGELDVLIGNRSATYGLLSRLYEREVDEDLLDELCSMRFPVRTGNETVDSAYRLLHSYLCTRWERTLEDLRIDYARIFFGNGSDSFDAAYPFESVHTSGERLMMQDARDEVCALYRAEGLGKSELWKDNEDHIALELAFEMMLCNQYLEARANEDVDGAKASLVKQQSFLNDHLLNWIPLMVASMDRFAKTDFYRAVGMLTIGFLETDEEFLNEAIALFDTQDAHTGSGKASHE
jgi:putative dimethyl sulfoxide reductase chaperone